MGLEGLAKFMKYTLVVFNSIFVILGAVCLGVGIWVLVDGEKVLEVANLETSNFAIPSLLKKGGYMLIGGGAFMLLVGVLGCVGAVKESPILLTTYAVLITILFVIQLVAGILAAVYHAQIEGELKSFLKEAVIKDYYGTWDADSVFSQALDYIQLQFDCCGIDSEADFNNATKWTGPGSVPLTCCKFTDKTQYPENPSALQPADTSCPGTPSPTNAWLNKWHLEVAE